MPFTFSHPLAVVPLRRWCPRWLNFAALVIGSLAPDFGYYVRQFVVASHAHSVLGTFSICLPAGLLVLVAFYLLRSACCFLLPNPHREALMPIATMRPEVSLRSFLVAAISILIGAATHSVWDSFTHTGAWAVEKFAWLRAPLLTIGGTSLPVSYVLQQLSTVGAGGVLIFLYWKWLQRVKRQPAVTSGGDRWRYLVLAGIALAAITIAAPAAFQMASHYDGYLAFRVFVFRCGVYSVAAFGGFFVLAAVILQRRFSRGTPSGLE